MSIKDTGFIPEGIEPEYKDIENLLRAISATGKKYNIDKIKRRICLQMSSMRDSSG